MSPSLRKHKVNSLRKKDAMWIYKHPQGLQILEDELNERRKKRAARQNRFVKRTVNFKSINQPHEQTIIPVVKKSYSHNQEKDRSEQKFTETNRSARQLHQTYSRTKMERSKSLRDEPKIQEAETMVESLQVVPSRKSTMDKPRLLEIANTPPTNTLSQARQKLLSVQQKSNDSFDRSANKTDPHLVRKKGIVSSFITAFEGPASSSASVPSSKNRDKNDIKSSPKQKLQTSQPDFVRESPKIQEYKSSPINMPQKSEPICDSYFTMNPLSLSNGLPPRYYTSSPESVSSLEKEEFSKSSGLIQRGDSESSISIYSPQLSPELSVDHDRSISASEERNKRNDDISEGLRPGIKKQVSFSEQLLTYIPEELDDSHSVVSSTCSSEILTPVFAHAQLPIKTEFVSNIDHRLSNEFSPVKKIMVTEKRTTDVQNRIANSQSARSESPVTKRPSIVPRKLSSKLLDMFQQKTSSTANSSPSTEPKQELVHLTKTRPRKPASLKKPTYPAATAQPDWRNRATNKKYEFVA
ncbi:hypothetical protein A0J61_03440 [Choanephora cucurbitarum]|uniref:Uncharacterized protein n=1 Tax=Choanephora cucurbitarum TaxID=101091 RepID=A0A1C7NHN3_9FUNG|nr:hypothetical protein A0J61_03440 [Choanephora cucurbitarum]